MSQHAFGFLAPWTAEKMENCCPLGFRECYVVFNWLVLLTFPLLSYLSERILAWDFLTLDISSVAYRLCSKENDFIFLNNFCYALSMYNIFQSYLKHQSLKVQEMLMQKCNHRSSQVLIVCSLIAVLIKGFYCCVISILGGKNGKMSALFITVL